MGSDGITRYVVTVKFHEQSLVEINALDPCSRLRTMKQSPRSWHQHVWLISPRNVQDVNERASGLAERIVSARPEMSVTTRAAWQKETQ